MLSFEVQKSAASLLRGKKPRQKKTESHEHTAAATETTPADNKRLPVDSRTDHSAKDNTVSDTADEPALDSANVHRVDEPVHRVDEPTNSILKPSFYWTWQLANDGYSCDEVTQIRNMDRQAVLEDLLLAAENSLEIKTHWLLSENEILELQRFLEEHRQTEQPLLFARLPKHLSTQKLLYFQKSVR